ncbi:hemolysin-type calcium-binding protein [Polaromonas sp. CF318]|uniref:calcium-binding protein n=1 Tax=Polaromonas sp. CF318 TaxID=1144318 RepID=UPI00027101B4|nr:calcium-binding protein [Polaromonas sp. CF318]EJL78514.1 hemolysin-type calcium-binding protein [Polaromonas sp. CF318]
MATKATKATKSIYNDAQVIASLVPGPKWTGSSITYNFRVEDGPAYSSLKNGVLQEAATDYWMQTYSSLIAKPIVRVDDAENANILLENDSSISGFAYTSSYPNPSGVSAHFPFLYPSSGGEDFMAFGHEIGHALGLSHPGSYNGGSATYEADAKYMQDSRQYNDIVWGGIGNDTIWGGIGNDTLYGNDDNDTLFGDAGNDTLDGGSGNNKLYGNEDSDILYSGAGSNRLDGGAGVDTVDYSRAGLARINANLLIGKVEKFLVAGGNAIADTVVGIENVLGTAGDDTITGDANANGLSGMGGRDTLDGGAGNDMLDGGEGDDTLSGGSNNDVLKGGKGNDTYLFKRGDAIDTIVENDATQGNTDVLKFADVKSTQLWFSRVNKAGKADKAGSSLQISILGSTTADKVTVQDWYLGNAYHVEQIKSSDGKTLLDMKTGKGANTDLELLVQAMASFTPPSASQTSLTLAQQTKLVAVLAGTSSNWLSS